MTKTLMHDIKGLLHHIECPVLCLRPDMTVSPWPGAVRHLQKLETVRFGHIAGDHCFIHSNPMDSSECIMRFVCEAQKVWLRASCDDSPPCLHRAKTEN